MYRDIPEKPIDRDVSIKQRDTHFTGGIYNAKTRF